jgi:hypothetical protein
MPRKSEQHNYAGRDRARVALQERRVAEEVRLLVETAKIALLLRAQQKERQERERSARRRRKSTSRGGIAASVLDGDADLVRYREWARRILGERASHDALNALAQEFSDHLEMLPADFGADIIRDDATTLAWVTTCVVAYSGIKMPSATEMMLLGIATGAEPVIRKVSDTESTAGKVNNRRREWRRRMAVVWSYIGQWLHSSCRSYRLPVEHLPAAPKENEVALSEQAIESRRAAWRRRKRREKRKQGKTPKPAKARRAMATRRG